MTIYWNGGPRTVPDGLLVDAGLDIRRSCGGKGHCGKCKVRVAPAPPPTPDERRLLTEKERKAGVRLACFLVLQPEMQIEPLDGAMRAAQIAVDTAPAVGVLSPLGDGVYGIAVDIGTTTLVVYLADLQRGEVAATVAALNPQRQFGDDVLTRIQYTIEHAAGREQLQTVLLRTLGEMIASLPARPDEIGAAVLAGNTVMTHFLLNEDAAGIAVAPFQPTFTGLLRTTPAAVPLPLRMDAEIVVAPSVSGYVGGDIVAGILDAGLLDRLEIALFIDIGTNGEMALGNREKLLCCAVAAGPAFEGSHIRCGMGGVAGAIDRFSFADGFTTIGGAPPAGICGSGLLDIIAALLRRGDIDETGRLETDFAVAGDIVLTPRDVREVQLAKAAVRAGIEVLLEEYGIGYDAVDRVYLAGGFGNYLRVESAVRIGMLPPELENRVAGIGNAAGGGCLKVLFDRRNLNELERIRNLMHYIELSGHAGFQDAYIEQMLFPEQ